jgi:hypothetical protein
MKEQPYKYMVRLPPQMQELIADSARHYRRSMNSDIVARLVQSFSGLPDGSREREVVPPLHEQFEALFRRDLSPDEEHLIRHFRRLPKSKKAALLSLLV